MTYKLYLDDKRTPRSPDEWVIVRNYTDFVNAVTTRGWPTAVSFDHDLDEGQPTGMDVAKWLVYKGYDEGVDPTRIEWNVHSANPAGAENIRGLITSWKKMHGRRMDEVRANASELVGEAAARGARSVIVRVDDIEYTVPLGYYTDTEAFAGRPVRTVDYDPTKRWWQ